jgi:putative aminopeptidase FrvX
MPKTTKSLIPEFGQAQIDLLERLSNAVAVSGDEREVRKIVLEEIRPVADELRTDALGNVLAVRKAKKAHALRVMLAAHMDEVGFMLVEDEEGGWFKFETIGGIDGRYLVGKVVLVGKDHLPAVIGARPIHLTSADERSDAIKIENLRIDLGPENAKKVKAGDRAGFATRFKQVGPSLAGKALDNRVGVATLIELFKHAPENIELCAAFTVQEELGLRGAGAAAYTFDPDLAIALDSTPAYDLPDWDGEENVRYNTRLDAGPAIYVADSGTLSDPRLISFLLKTAEKAGIPCQVRQPGGGGTDAGAIHRRRAGIPSVSVSVPGRYAHTPMLISRREDWKNALALLHAALSEISPALLAEPR